MTPNGAPKGPILVIGDFCIDVALRAGASRLSRERPLPVFDLEDIAAAGGCASNAARQVAAYGAEVRLLPVAEAVKIRGLSGLPEQEVFRLDGSWAVVSAERLVPQLAELADVPFSAAIYVDYRGLAGPPPTASRFLARLPCPQMADARRSLRGWRGLSVLKMNARDAGLPDQPSLQEFRRAYNRIGVPIVVLTRGPLGHIVLGPDTAWEEPVCSLPGPVLNVSGAGDVFTATLAVLLASAWERYSSNPSAELVHEASKTAALAAGLRIRKAGYNETVTWEEIETCKSAMLS